MNAPGLSFQIDKYIDYLNVLATTMIGVYLRSRGDASDIVSQTLVEAHVNREQFQGGTDQEYMKWLRIIMARNAKDFAKAHLGPKRDVRRDKSIDQYLDDSSGNLVVLAGKLPSPSENVRHCESMSELHAAIEQLTPDRKQAILLHFLQKMKLAETAAVMNRTVPSVAGLVNSGLRDLRRIMSGRGIHG